MIEKLIINASSLNPLILAIYGGLFVTFTTSLGALIAVLFKKLPEWGLELSMAFGGGVMLVASFTSLIIPAIGVSNIYLVMLGIVLGFLLIFLIEKYLPHEHIVAGYEGPEKFRHKLKHIWLIVIAIVIHNLPEGMAVGVSLVNNVKTGIATTIAIGIQDIPEGLAVAFPIYRITKSVRKSLGISFLSGFSELLAGLIPFIIISLYPQAIGTILPFLMSFSAGAMIYVVVHELVPEIYSHGHDDLSTLGFFSGFLIMLLLDTLLG